MTTRHTFPQPGDTNDAAKFAQHLGRSNITDYVQVGMNLSPDYTVPEVTVSDGKVYLRTENEHASLANEDLNYGFDYVIEFTSRTIGLVDNAKNYVYLDGQVDTDDSPQLHTNTTGGSPGEDFLLVGVVDTSDNTSKELSRDPTATHMAQAMSQTIDDERTFEVPAGYRLDAGDDYTVEGELVLNDGATLDTNRHPARITNFGTVRANQGLMTTDEVQSHQSITVPEGYTMLAPEDFTVDGTLDIQGELLTISDNGGITIQNIENERITLSSGQQPAFNGSVKTGITDETRKFDPVLSVADGANSAYAYNKSVSKRWDGSEWIVDLTVNWDADPGSDVNLDVEVQTR